MKYFIIFISLVSILLISCSAPAKFVITKKTFPPYSGPIKVLYKKPSNQKFEVIGLVSSTDGTTHNWAYLIEEMQKQAGKYGANAIINLKEDRERQVYLSYTQQLGLFGATGNKKDMMAIDIKIAGVSNQNTIFYNPENKFFAGLEINTIPYIFSGYNGSIWFGKNGFRLRGEISKINTPDAYWRDGFEKDRPESYGLNVDFFPLSEFEGFWISTGFFNVKGSLGHEDEVVRGNYEYLNLQTSLGYLIRFNDNFYLNSGAVAFIHIGGDKKVMVGSHEAVFDNVTPAVSLSLGFNF